MFNKFSQVFFMSSWKYLIKVWFLKSEESRTVIIEDRSRSIYKFFFYFSKIEEISQKIVFSNKWTSRYRKKKDFFLELERYFPSQKLHWEKYGVCTYKFSNSQHHNKSQIYRWMSYFSHGNLTFPSTRSN